MYIYLIPDTKYQEQNKCIFSTCSFSFILHQIFLKYRAYSRQIWVDSFQNKRSKMQRNFLDGVLRFPQQSKHIALIRLHARLVKWIDAQYITTYGTGFFKEIKQITELVRIGFG